MMIEAVLYTIDGQSQNEIVNILNIIARNFLGAEFRSNVPQTTEQPLAAEDHGVTSSGFGELGHIDKALREVFDAYGKKDHLSDLRSQKQLAARMRRDKCSEEIIDAMKLRFKHYEAMRLAKLIERCCSTVIEVLNKDKSTTVFNRLLTLNPEDKTPESPFATFCSSPLRTGLRRFGIEIFQPGNSKNETNVRNFIHELQSIASSNEYEEQERLNEICQLVG